LTLSIVLAAAACTDNPADRALTTAPGKPRLSMSTLPSDASTICVANVRARDELLAHAPAEGASSSKLDALGAVIEDTCY
jgi:hypothetical protein